MIFQMARAGTILQALGHFPALKNFLLKLVPKSVIEERAVYERMTKEMLLRRMALKERPDLINGMLEKRGRYVSKASLVSCITIDLGRDST
jgi:hypothetical protein